MSIHAASLVKYYKYDIIKTYVNKDMEVVFMSIVCIGQCAYDLTFPIHEPLIENQKYRIMEPFSCIGAPAANAAYLCALWKADTALISRCGYSCQNQSSGWTPDLPAVFPHRLIRRKAFCTDRR